MFVSPRVIIAIKGRYLQPNYTSIMIIKQIKGVTKYLCNSVIDIFCLNDTPDV